MLERIIYTTKPGEQLKRLDDGNYLIAGGDEPPRVLHIDGKIERLTPDNYPEVWAVWEHFVKQRVNPN